ncbi:unknown [Acetobacter sp. CAG:267]|nr:unknown [Acetobacter sp. CAG:267]
MQQKKVPIFSASACGYNVLIFCKVIKTKVDDFKRTFFCCMPQLRFNPIPFLSIYIRWILRSRTKTAITSSLPKTMTNDRIYFTKGVNPVKLPAGPVASVRVFFQHIFQDVCIETFLGVTL